MYQIPVVFAGPSIPPSDRIDCGDLTFRAPAEAGDVLKLLGDPPPAICIIDGYFGDRMAVMHKEILHALSLGVRVYGAASIGALRAAELETYGMIGIGKIFRAYRDGDCIRDDAVAVTHGPAETGYAQTTLAEMDILATADALKQRGRVTIAERTMIQAACDSIHFTKRTWEALATKMGRPDLVDLLKESFVHRKRLDALEAIHRVQEDFRLGRAGIKTNFAPPPTPAYRKHVDIHCPQIA